MATGEQSPVPGSEQPAPASEQVTPTPEAPPSAGVQTSADGERIPLPPPITPPDVVPDFVLHRVHVLEGFLVLLLLALAFLLGSFRASNADLFLNLAVGRLIAQGSYAFGSDPFTFTSSGTWVNNAWLFDLLAYALYSLPSIGGTVLVVVKALAVTLLAWLVLRAGSLDGRPRWIPVVCSLIAVLAASPRFFLQPAVASMVLLAAVLNLLFNPGERGKRLWWIPLLCVLWVNLDEWFLFGPLSVLLFLLGEWMQTRQSTPDEADAGRLRTLGLVSLASIAACLVSPFHFRNFTTLPVGLVQFGGTEVLSRDALFRGFFFSPVLNFLDYIRNPLGHSVAGIAWFLLLGLGLLSFLLTAFYNPRGLRWGRVLLWLAFAILGSLNLRLSAFFAVVAGPITALNFLDLVGVMFGASMPADRAALRWAVSGRVLTSLVVLGLILASIPGVLHGKPFHRRAVEWTVEVNPSLRQAAEKIDEWRRAKVIAPGQHWFTTAPEVVSYLAWFCPGEKGALDYRLNLFAERGRDIVETSRVLGMEPPDKGGEWTETLTREYRKRFSGPEGEPLRFLIWHGSPSSYLRSAQSLAMMFAQPREFVPCFMEGNTAIFAWCDPGKARAAQVPAGMGLNFEAMAFGPNAVQAPEDAPPVPDFTYWDALYPKDTPAPMGALLAAQHEQRFDSLGSVLANEVMQDWRALTVAQLVGAGAQSGGSLPISLLLHLRMNRPLLVENLSSQSLTAVDQVGMYRANLYVSRLRDSGSVADLYLGIRAARRGLLEAPEEVTAETSLAKLYYRLNSMTRERACTHRPAQLGQERPVFLHPVVIRQGQIAAAMRTVLKVSTRAEDVQQAHRLLNLLYANLEIPDPKASPFFESRVHHLSEYVRLTKSLGPGRQMPPEQFGEMVKQMDEQVKRLTRELKTRRGEYELATAGKRATLLQKAEDAASRGLCETALKLLLDPSTRPEDLRDPRNPTQLRGATMALWLLLGLGRIDEVREALQPTISSSDPGDPLSYGFHPQLGVPAYPWFRMQLAAATGDYAAADRHLVECMELGRKGQMYASQLVLLDVAPEKFATREIDEKTFAAFVVGNVLLREAPKAAGMPFQLSRILPFTVNRFPGRDGRPQHALRDPDYRATLAQTQQFLIRTMQPQADLMAVRAWLALEAGHVDRAQEYAEKAMRVGDLGEQQDGQRLMVAFPAHNLANLVLEYREKGAKK